MKWKKMRLLSLLMTLSMSMSVFIGVPTFAQNESVNVDHTAIEENVNNFGSDSVISEDDRGNINIKGNSDFAAEGASSGEAENIETSLNASDSSLNLHEHESDSDIPDYITKTQINGVDYLEFDSGQDFEWLRSHVLNGGDGDYSGGKYCRHNIILKNDIDMTGHNGVNNGKDSGIGWGQRWLGYAGIFDGGGHTISNLDVYTDTPVGPKGLLFNITKDATIKNVAVQGKVESNRYIGGLVGRTTGSLTLENVLVNAELKLSSGNANAMGGLIGQLGSGQTTGGDKIIIKNCAAVGSIESQTSSNPVGGLIGHIYGGFDVSISNSYAASDLKCEGGNKAGLIAGNGTNKLQITNCYFLDTMADKALNLLNGHSDEGAVGPDSSFVNAVKKTKLEMKSDEFITCFNQGTFRKDVMPFLANGYPVPTSIENSGASNDEWIWEKFDWSEVSILECNEGESIDTSEIKVTANYKNNHGDVNKITVSDIQVDKTTPLEMSDNGTDVKITVIHDGHTENKTFQVTVRELQSIEIKQNPKLFYFEDDVFNTNGMKVIGNFENNRKGEIPLSALSIEPDGPLKPSDTKVTISYKGKSVQLDINVTPLIIKDFRVIPSNLIYAADEDFDYDNLKVQVKYNTGYKYVDLNRASDNNNPLLREYKLEWKGNTATVSYSEKAYEFKESFTIQKLNQNVPKKIGDTYMLSTVDDMVWFANQVNSYGNPINGKVINDIDLTDAKLFKPIGRYSQKQPISTDLKYKGHFDGGNHIITVNLHPEVEKYKDGINEKNRRTAVGLFGFVSGESEIKNIIVEGNITAADASDSVGGIIGNLQSSETTSHLTGCINRANITVAENNKMSYAGGIIGLAAAQISEKPYIIKNCKNEGKINSLRANCRIGGIVGSGRNINIIECSNSGNVSGLLVSGGILGECEAQNNGIGIEKSFNSGNITGKNVGGILGAITINQKQAVINSCYNKGNIKGILEAKAGGIVGYAHPNVFLTAHGDAILKNVYNSGNVEVETNVSANEGMLIGYCGSQYITLKDSCYLSDNAKGRDAYSKAENVEISSENVFPKSGNELKNIKILELLGQDFKLTNQNDGYPMLVWENYEENTGIEEHRQKGSSSSVKTDSLIPTDIPMSNTVDNSAGNTVQEKLPFADVNTGEWYYDDIQEMYKMGVMDGTSTDKFSPNLNTTRGMMVTILYRIENKPSVSDISKFTDIGQNKWYTEAVNWAALNNIASGYGDGSFRPDQEVSRQELATFLYRYAKMKKYDVKIINNLSRFADSKDIAPWAEEAIAWANTDGIMRGNDMHKLDPNGVATRAHLAAMTIRMVKTYNK